MRNPIQAARDEDHIAKYGHQALYSRHTCRLCGLDWHCRLNSCRLEQEDVLCRSCEVESFLDLVTTIGTEVTGFLKVFEGESPWSASLKAKLQGLIDDALRITLMEKI